MVYKVIEIFCIWAVCKQKKLYKIIYRPFLFAALFFNHLGLQNDKDNLPKQIQITGECSIGIPNNQIANDSYSIHKTCAITKDKEVPSNTSLAGFKPN